MTGTWRSIFAAFLVVLSGSLEAQEADEAPITTTLCAVKQAPERFNGKLIQVRARLVTAFEFSNLIDDSCGVRTSLSWGDRPIVFNEYGDEVAVEFAYIRSRTELKHPERLNWFTVGKPRIKPVTSESSATAERYLDKFYDFADDLSACPGFCPKYTVVATVTGRFDFINKRKVVAVKDVATGRIDLWQRANGFGHLGASDSQFAMQSVSDVVATPIDRAVYKKGK